MAEIIRPSGPEKIAVSTIYEDGRLKYDFEEHLLETRGCTFNVPRTQRRTLAVLLSKPGELITFAEFASAFSWLTPISGMISLRNNIIYLRKKVDGPNATKSCIVSISGHGYKYVPTELQDESLADIISQYGLRVSYFSVEGLREGS